MSNELALQAQAAYEAGDYERAIQGFRSAQLEYQAAGQPSLAAQMANSLCVVLLKVGRAEEALSAVEGTPEILAQLGDRPHQALATGNLAAALEACDRIEQAEAAYRSAIAQFEKLDDPEALRHTRQALSQLQLRQNRPLEAAETLSADQGDRSLRGRLIRMLMRIPSKLLRS